jgi:hypothetical protein
MAPGILAVFLKTWNIQCFITAVPVCIKTVVNFFIINTARRGSELFYIRQIDGFFSMQCK